MMYEAALLGVISDVQWELVYVKISDEADNGICLKEFGHLGLTSVDV